MRLTLSPILNEVKDLDLGSGEILRFRLAWKSFHEEYIGKHFEVKPAGFFSARRAFSPREDSPLGLRCVSVAPFAAQQVEPRVKDAKDKIWRRRVRH